MQIYFIDMDIFTPLVIGLPAIDSSLDGLLEQLKAITPSSLGNITSLAKSLGLLLAMCVGAYECWMMMLGRRVIDVMKLFRILGLSFCITFSGTIVSVLTAPGKGLEATTKAMAKTMNGAVAKKELQVAKLQDKYYQKVRALQDSIESAKRIATIGDDANWMEKVHYSITNLGNTIENFSKRAAIVTETKITEWANLIIRFIGEAIFQITYYGLLVMQLVFMKILGMFAPLMFALSIAPPWSNAWSQWISKYLSISLWGFVVYLCVYYADAILLYTLEKDITAYTALIGKSNLGSWESIGTLGMQGIGSTCMYFVGMCIGAVLLKSVPEVCSWLIPGGVSSSGAGSSGAAMMGAANTTSQVVVGSGKAVAGAAMSAIGGPATMAAGVAGGFSQSKNDGKGTFSSAVNSVVSQTSLGKAFSQDARNQRSFNSAKPKSKPNDSPSK